MNILIFSWRGPGHPNEGGAEQVAQEHAKAWIKAGHNVTLFTSHYDGARNNEIVDGVEVIRKGGQVFGVQLSAFFWYLFKKHKRFDLVIDHFHGIPFFTPFYIRIKKLAVIHEVAKEVWRLNPWRKPFNLIPMVLGPSIEPLLFKIIYKNVPFLTGSKSTEVELIEWGIPKKNITIIHHGVNLDDKPKRFLPKNKMKTAIFLGAISKDKGIFDALKVFSEIYRKDDSWKFWIVGRADENIQKEVKKSIKQLGISKNVTIWGFVNNKRKFELLAKSYVMVNPSIREGWGLVNIEANSVGTPVIAYDVSGCRDSIKNGITGVLVKFGDISNMAYQVIKLVNDSNRYMRMQCDAIKWSRRFSWKVSSKKSLELIESI
jgi:glycosyltransferase involved in cell wall biosynthesis